MSTNFPDWLPDPIETDGSWDEILNRLWTVFDSQIARGLFFNGRPVWHSIRIENGKPGGFWHVTHRDDRVFDSRRRTMVKQRNFDPGRSRCLSWLRTILENTHRDEVLVWDYCEDDGRMVTYVWLECCDYVIILGHEQTRRGMVYRIISAYVTDYPRKRDQLWEKYENREP
jgi:hypothetical protein